MTGVRDRHVLVVGLATSGEAAARALLADGAVVRAVDERLDVACAEELRGLGAEVRLGPHALGDLDGIDLVVPSPGVPPRVRILAEAVRRGLEVRSELDLGAARAGVPSIAITGTNGKSTTTELVASILRAGGRDAIACGNIGYPLIRAAGEGHDVLAVEASSFQLHFAPTFHPRVSVITNLAADHLDWHGDLSSYAEAKARIFANQRGDDVHVGNATDPLARALSTAATCRRIWFRVDEPGPGEVGWSGDAVVARLEDTTVVEGIPDGGPAWREDVAAAVAATLAFGCDAESVGEGIRSMRRLPHRGDVVAVHGGVRFIDDSKATNVHAALAAMAGHRDVVLIAGGLAKGVDLSPLLAASEHLAGVVAIGEAAPQLLRLFDGVVATRSADSIEEAVIVAASLAPAGGTVLLAPACASWDMFRDYVERGERFAAAARALEGAVTHG